MLCSKRLNSQQMCWRQSLVLWCMREMCSGHQEVQTLSNWWRKYGHISTYCSKWFLHPLLAFCHGLCICTAYKTKLSYTEMVYNNKVNGRFVVKCNRQGKYPNISSSAISFKLWFTCAYCCHCLYFATNISFGLQRFGWLYVIFCVTCVPRNANLFHAIMTFPGNNTPRTRRTAWWGISVRS